MTTDLPYLHHVSKNRFIRNAAKKYAMIRNLYWLA